MNITKHNNVAMNLLKILLYSHIIKLWYKNIFYKNYTLFNLYNTFNYKIYITHSKNKYRLVVFTDINEFSYNIKIINYHISVQEPLYCRGGKMYCKRVEVQKLISSQMIWAVFNLILSSTFTHVSYTVFC